MDVFAGWNDYTSRLENNWRKLVTDNDTVVVSGDISWAMTKMDVFLKNNSLDSISILFNNSYVVDDYAICGTRGWFLENESQNDIKVLNREVGRLEMSIQSAIKTGKEPIVFLHYPPVYGTTKCDEIFNVLLKYDIRKCYYGHLHGKKNMRFAIEGEYEGIDFKLISCDRLSFMPILVR